MKRSLFCVAAIFCCVATNLTAARAEPHVLRLATAAPDGTAYSRELKLFAREVADATAGEVQLKWYWGGIAGDDAAMLDRVRRDQLDGFGSGLVCQLVAPTFRALHAPGLFRSRDELRAVASRLGPELVDEFRRAGFEYLGFGVLGRVGVFSRNPVRTLDDLKREKLWVWDQDTMLARPLTEMGLHLVALPIDAAGAAYRAGRHDGFLTIPSGTLAFGWYTLAHYLTELHINWLTACVAITTRAFDRLPIAHQRAIHAAAARLAGRMELVNLEQDKQLEGGLFTKQGVQPVAISDETRRAFATQALAAVERLGGQIVAPPVFKRVTELLAAHRSEHGEKP